jgi:glutaredoxin 3
MSDVKIYTTSVCPYCLAAKRLLQDRGVGYEEIRLDFDPDARRRLSQQLNGWRTVPMVFVREDFVGGFTELRDLALRGGLDDLSGSGPSTPE